MSDHSDPSEQTPCGKLLSVIGRFERSIARIEESIPLHERETLLELANNILKVSLHHLDSLKEKERKELKNVRLTVFTGSLERLLFIFSGAERVTIYAGAL